MKKKEKMQWGGNRPGSGRKKIKPDEKKVACGFALHPQAIAKISEVAKKLDLSLSAALERIIEKY